MKNSSGFTPSDSTDIQFQLLLKLSIYIPGGDLLSSPGSRLIPFFYYFDHSWNLTKLCRSIKDRR